MKGNPKIIDVLNKLLAEELGAINQYMVHSEMYDNWGYEKLHHKIEKNAMDEMKHAEALMQRILFLEGMPAVTKLGPIRIGKAIPEMITNDIGGEATAIKSYNEAVQLAVQLEDNGSRALFEKILQDEEGHIDLLECQRDQIGQMGLENYLPVQTEKKE
ncbi:MAG TPA: bacterioferritin [Elusimicrobiota bacterium]|nr:bacterioferritin [Elusimicrobiota bacterium]